MTADADMGSMYSSSELRLDLLERGEEGEDQSGLWRDGRRNQEKRREDNVANVVWGASSDGCVADGC